MAGRVGGKMSYPLLVCLVDRIQCILDRHALEVPRRYLEPQREVQVDLLNWGCCEQLLEIFLVLDC